MKVWQEGDFVVGAHVGGCVTVQYRPADRPPVCLLSLRPFPGYLVAGTWDALPFASDEVAPPRVPDPPVPVVAMWREEYGYSAGVSP